MSNQSDKKLIHELFEAINQANFAMLDEHPGFWETRQVVPPMHALFKDWRTKQFHSIAEDGKVFSHANIQMTHVGPFAGMAATNKPIIIEGFFLDQVIEERVVEHNGTTSWPDVIRQIGHPAFQQWPTSSAWALTQSTPIPARNRATLATNKQIVAHLLESLSRGDDSAAARHEDIGQLYADFKTIRNAFPDLHYTTVMQVAEGDLVGTRATLHGTHEGELFGFAATNKPITWDYFNLARFVGHTIVDTIGSADWTAAMIQLGLFPM